MSFDSIRTSEDAIEEAKELGLEVFIPDKYTLTVDLDSEEAFARYQERLKIFQEYYQVESIIGRPSKSGWPNRHFIIKMYQGLSIPERLLLQLYLNSDSLREFLSYQQFLIGDETPILLFNKKENVK